MLHGLLLLEVASILLYMQYNASSLRILVYSAFMDVLLELYRYSCEGLRAYRAYEVGGVKYKVEGTKWEE
jgi:hypothetical protein